MTKIKLISDIHIGTRFSRSDLVKEAFKGNDPIMLGGDLGDWISPKDPRYDEDCIMSPDEQVSSLIKLLKGKNIISMIDGNHENSIKRYTGFDVSRLISEQLDIPFNGPTTYVDIDGVTIYNYHGSGGGAFKGTILTKLEKVPMHRGAHVYVQGHSHQLFTVPTAVEINGKRELNWLINSGSFMDDATYARNNNLPPSVLGYAVYDTSEDYAYPVLLGNKRKINNIYKITEENLSEFYKQHSLKETVAHFNCSERTIMRRVKKFGLSKR